MGQTAGTPEKVDDSEKSSSADSKALDVLRFTVNGKLYTVDNDVDSNTRLAKYLRENLGLTGTKTMCWEGGCGACVVTLSTIDPTTGHKKISSVNSCLVPLLQCHEAEITTVEGLGDKKVGYHPVQSRLADLNGTQCGYCSPGMVMSMHSVLEKNQGQVSSKDVEEAIDGNLCRCTGYRPIMTAFKTFANDTPATADIEELGTKLCKKGTGPCTKSSCTGDCPPKIPMKVALADGTWERPENLSDLLNLFNTMPPATTYRLIAGNTGQGLFRNDGPYQVHIDISRIAELQQVSLSTPLTLGGAVTLTRMIEVMDSIGATNPDYWYGPIIAEHVRKVAGTSIRNMATIAGNLMLKHKHPQFTSDIVVLLETVGATLSIRNETGTQTVLSVADFLKTSMEKKIIVSVNFFPISKDHIIRTFKIMPRANNAFAYISAGFRIRVDPQNNFLVLATPSIVYGGISPSFIHASVAESYLAGKFMGDENVLQAVLQVLSDEIVPVENPPNPDPAYLHSVALSLFYKFALAVVGDLADATYRSGATALERGLATGQQTFDPDTSQGPLYKPIPKVEARAQTSGEAQFFDDTSSQANELHAAFVLSTVANCTLDSIDASEALNQEGVVAFYDAKNIPGPNICIDQGSQGPMLEDEEVFCSSKVLYSGQPLGLVVARSHELAMRAARMVVVKYKDFQTPILTVREAMKYPDRLLPTKDVKYAPRTHNLSYGNKKPQRAGATRIIEGEFESGSQFNFYMETQFTRCVPTEDGMQVYCGTYDMDYAQRTIAKALRMNKNQIEMQIRRLGGCFGGKYAPAIRVAVACAMAAGDLKQPVRMKLDFRSNMEFVGGRQPHYCKYKVEVDDQGIFQNLEIDIYGDAGGNFNEAYVGYTAFLSKTCYKPASWKATPYIVKTDTAKNTYCRGPGPAEAVAIMENIVEHVAKETGIDPLELRLKNLNDEAPSPRPGAKTIAESLTNILNQLVESSQYNTRKLEVAQFNNENRWKKRGLSIIAMLFDSPTNFPGVWFNCLVSIYHHDGSVVVTHGGVESGQGINTKVAQVVARELEIPIDLVSVKATNTLTNPNTYLTGGSFTSELNCYGIALACRDLVERMKPIKDTLVNPDWKTLVEACYMANIDLTGRHYLNPANDKLTGYNVYGATVAEVELDVLTGDRMIRRVDIIEDAGHSLNPLVDVGQVEGGFMMGVGLWTSEKVQFDPVTGRKLTVGTSQYLPPASKDIPRDFRVTLLKNSVNPNGVLGAKATGEPPLGMGVSVLIALKNALEAARKDSGRTDWFPLNGPATVDVLQKLALVDTKQFVYHAK